MFQEIPNMYKFNRISNIEFPKSLSKMPLGTHNVKNIVWYNHRKWGEKVRVTLADNSEYFLTPRINQFLKEHDDLFIIYKNLADVGKLQLEFLGGNYSNFKFIPLDDVKKV